MIMQYFGHMTMTYPHYIDLATGKTLVCVPGNSYNIAPASGYPLSVNTPTPNDGRFAGNLGREAKPEKEKKAVRTEAESSESERASR